MDSASSSTTDALTLLVEGNDRFRRGEPVHPHQSPSRVAEIAGHQEPFATVLTCSDSRVSEAVVFDRGLGDIFGIRTAGHVVDRSVLATVEFATADLGVPLLVVLGHENCGAVGAALRVMDSGETLPGSMPYLSDAIEAHVHEHGSVRDLTGDALTSAAVRCHVRETVNDLVAQSPILQAAQADGSLLIAGAVYSLATGEVEFLA